VSGEDQRRFRQHPEHRGRQGHQRVQRFRIEALLRGARPLTRPRKKPNRPRTAKILDQATRPSKEEEGSEMLRAEAFRMPVLKTW